MRYKKQLKWVAISMVAVIVIFVTIYYASVTRAENLEEAGTNFDLKSVVTFIKQFLPNFDFTNVSNTALLEQTDKNLVNGKAVVLPEKDIVLAENSLNRELLNICLAKAEDEWSQLQKHYADVLLQCLNLELGLNGEKLFSNDECENQIKPYREQNKQRIQTDKADCFNRYSERE